MSINDSGIRSSRSTANVRLNFPQADPFVVQGLGDSRGGSALGDGENALARAAKTGASKTQPRPHMLAQDGFLQSKSCPLIRIAAYTESNWISSI